MLHTTLLMLHNRRCRPFLEAQTQLFHRLLWGWNLRPVGHPPSQLKKGVTPREAYIIIEVCTHCRFQANQKVHSDSDPSPTFVSNKLGKPLCLHASEWQVGTWWAQTILSVLCSTSTPLVTLKDKAPSLGWLWLPENMNQILSPTSTYFYTHAWESSLFLSSLWCTVSTAQMRRPASSDRMVTYTGALSLEGWETHHVTAHPHQLLSLHVSSHHFRKNTL